jgi:hypothetical protein
MQDPIEDVLCYRLRFAALDTFVSLGCAEALSEGAHTSAALAAVCEADANLLTRVLRTLRAAGIVTEEENCQWTLAFLGFLGLRLLWQAGEGA